MATKTDAGIELAQALGIKNPFVRDWKDAVFSDGKKRIASIAITRNLIEYTRGSSTAEYMKLASLLHWKDDSSSIMQSDLDDIYVAVFKESGRSQTETNR